MMRLWEDSYTKTTPVFAIGALSVVVHTVIIAAWVFATLPAENMPNDSLANRTYAQFQPPPDRTPGQRGQQERVHYLDLLKEGPGMGDGIRTFGDERPVTIHQTVGRAAADSETAPPVTPVPGPPDSVFSVLEVDTAVVRTANSAAPAYPLKLLQAHIMGFVSAQYVVDTTGFADTASFHVMKSTNSAFEEAVREALPYMRFTPAKIGSTKVRQLVEQQFTFKINDSLPLAPKRKP
jgi:hypothetical protein